MSPSVAPRPVPKLKKAFRKARVLAPLHTGGPVALTSDGRRIVTCLGEEVLLTDVDTGETICRFKGDGTEVTAFTLSPSARHLLVFYKSLSLRVYELPIEQQSQPVPPIRHIARAHDAPVHVCIVDPTSTLLASGAADGVVKIWDILQGYVTHSFKGHGGVVSALTFNFPRDFREGQRIMQLVTGSVDTRIRIFDLNADAARKSGARAHAVLEGHVSVPRGLSVSPDGRWLVSGGRDSVVLIWDISGRISEKPDKKGKSKAQDAVSAILAKTIPVLERVEAVGLLAPGEQYATASGDDSGSRLRFYTGGSSGIVKVWDATDGEAIMTLGNRKADAGSVDEQHEIVDVIYNPATSSLVSIHADQNIIFHSLPTASTTRQLIGFNDEVIDAVFLSLQSSLPDSHIALATNSSLIRVYSSTSFDARLLAAHTDMVLCLDRGAGGRLLASGSKDKTARIWSRPSPEASAEWSCVAVCEGHAESVGAVAVARKAGEDGSSPRFLFTGSQDRTIKMWDLTSLRADTLPSSPLKPKSLTTHKAHEKDINSLDVSPNDKLLASGSQDKTIKIFEIDYVTTSAGTKGDIKVLGICKGHKRGVWTVRFGRDDRVLASGSGDKSVKIWSLDDFSCLKTFEGHTNSVLRVDFLTHGMQVVSTASDGLVKIWNAKDEECMTSLDNHEDKVWALALSREESTIVSAGADSVVTFWEDCTEEQEEEKEAKRVELVAHEQDFTNYLSLKDYRSAILLALSMDQPGRLLKLFTSVIGSRQPGSTSITGSSSVDLVIKMLPPAELVRLLRHVRDWNATARTSTVAQTILHAVLKLRTAEEIVAAFNSSDTPDLLDLDSEETSERERRTQNGDNISLREVVDALLPYSERHYARADRLVQDSFVVDHILGQMDDWLFDDSNGISA